ncbi:putative leucine-rich repeat-containing protein DDB_G0290503 isoform X2 [Xyrichtys novacula]|nr:putative leucine-rich repeat-containing protein DDB_G0290503 isoform X2 [Xyrichtys novacula]
MEDELSEVDRLIQRTSERNTQLENEAMGLRRNLRQVNDQLSTCSSTASAITDSYQTHLQTKLKNLLGNLDSDKSLTLKVISNIKEVIALKNRLQHAANSTKSAAEIEGKELQKKTSELNMKMTQINDPLIAEIVSLQKQIWDLEQTETGRDNNNLLPSREVQALEEQLNPKLSELQRRKNPSSTMLALITVQNKITKIQKLITIAIEQSKSGATVFQKKRSEKIELLKQKIGELNDDENNSDLTKEILALQLEVDQLRALINNAKKAKTSQIIELKVILETERTKQYNLQKELEAEDYAKAQQILKIITMMKELRELQAAEQDQAGATNTTTTTTTTTTPTTSGQVNTLQKLLETKEREYASAQAEIRELQTKLQLKSEKCSGPKDKYEEIKTKFEENIAELNRAGDSKPALVLSVINLHHDVKTLRDQIEASEDPDRVSELKNQLERKQSELNSKSDEIEKVFSNPNIILTVIELLDDKWDQQDSSDSSSSSTQDYEDRIGALISRINGDESTKLLLQLLTLQTQLADVQPDQTTQPTDEQVAKRRELQKQINELKNKNQANSRLINSVTDLHNDLRNQEKKKKNEGKTSALIAELREQLEAIKEEHSHDQAQIQTLQNQLNQTEEECANNEQKIEDLQDDLDAKLKELESKSDTVTSLALQISTLTQQLEDLKRQLQKSDSESKIKKLQKIIEEKTDELAKKTEELKKRSAQPHRFLQIFELQTKIDKLASVAANSTDFDMIRALQDQLNHLIEGIQDENNENTKLMFHILAQHNEIATLKKQEESQLHAELEKIKSLEDELEDIREQIKRKTQLLNSSDMRIANLSAQIVELHQKIQPLQDQISDLKEVHAENLEELKDRLNLTNRQLQDSEHRLQDADAKNFKSIKEIADLKTKLKQAQRQGSRLATRDVNELKQQLEAQQKKNQKLEKTNEELKHEIQELKTCCSDQDTQCEDIQTELDQSHKDTDRLQQQLQDKDTNLKQLQQDLAEQTRKTHVLQNEYSKLREQQLSQGCTDLQQQLDERDARLKQLQEQFENRTRAYNKLQDDFNNLEIKKNQVLDDMQRLREKVAGVLENMIHGETINMDPDTAHKRIILSRNNTELNIDAENQDVADQPGRYDVSLAVLGSTGFSSGRHYWEVSVAGRLCYHIGMASESAKRRGTIKFRPSNGYWTIIQDRQGQYIAKDRLNVRLPLQTRPLSLGILLDYKEGQISFFDPEARSHIYSFVSQKFSGKVFPFIGFCVEDVESQTPMVLHTPGSVDWLE